MLDGWKLTPVLVASVACAVYLNTAGHGWVYDDLPGILGNPLIYGPSSLREVFSVLGEPWRPLVQFSYALTHRFFGFDPRVFHSENIIIHTLNSVIVWGIARQVAALWLGPGRAVIFPLSTGLLFAVHPLHSEAVAYVWGRSSSLCASFYFGSVFLVLAGCRQDSGRKRSLWLSSAVLAGLLAWKCKEEAITLPLVVSGIFWLVGWRAAALSAAFVPVALMVSRRTDIASLYTRVSRNEDLVLAGANPALPGDLHFMTGVKSAVFYYLNKFLLPVSLNVDPHVEPVETPWDLQFMTASLILLGLVALAWLARRKQPALCFGLLTLLASPLTAYACIPLADVVAEHRIYIAGLGFALVIAWCLSFRKNLSLVLLAAVTATLFSTTVVRNRVWHDSITLWQDSASKSPRLARPHLNLGAAYQVAGLNEEALAEFRQAVSVNPRLVPAYSNMVAIYLLRGDLDEAEACLSKAIDLAPDRVTLYAELAAIVLRRQEPQKALAILDRARGRGELSTIHFARGEALLQLGRYPEAAGEYRRAMELEGESGRLAPRIRSRIEQIDAMDLSGGTPPATKSRQE